MASANMVCVLKSTLFVAIMHRRALPATDRRRRLPSICTKTGHCAFDAAISHTFEEEKIIIIPQFDKKHVLFGLKSVYNVMWL